MTVVAVVFRMRVLPREDDSRNANLLTFHLPAGFLFFRRFRLQLATSLLTAWAGKTAVVASTVATAAAAVGGRSQAEQHREVEQGR
jgi:hypothetical protein